MSQKLFFKRVALVSTIMACDVALSLHHPARAADVLPERLHIVREGAPTVVLAENGRALLPITVFPQADAQTQAAAQSLAEVLGKMSGAKFQVTPSATPSGITVGTVADFPALPFVSGFLPNEPRHREVFTLKSDAKGLQILSATPLGVQDAVWSFLERLGYRQYFPNPHWEIVPKLPKIAVSVDVAEKPDYVSRRISFTYGTWPDNQGDVNDWNAKNRVVAGVVINAGHSYPGIVHRNQAVFDAHPEYFTELNGKRQVNLNGKFDISNPDLRQLVADYYAGEIKKNPALDSVSVDPSDGGGWGNSPSEEKLGSISDRVTTLANFVADDLNQRFAAQYGPKYVGFYAYNFHSPPPSIRVHPNVIVLVATAFIQGGYSAEQLIDGWQKQGATIGIREYYSIIHWDHDLPGGARASNLDYFVSTIPKHFGLGARFLSAESSDNWGPCGLGYLFASKVLWNIDEAKNADSLTNDFLARSFGSAKEPMRDFYGLLYKGLDFSQNRPFSEDLVGRLYRDLDKAQKAGDDPLVQQRIADLTLYTRYLELYRAYVNAAGDERVANFETLIRFVYRIRRSHMVHGLAIYRTQYRDTEVMAKTPKDAIWKMPEGKNPWKSSEPFSPADIAAWIGEGVKNNALMPFEPVNFSQNLVPATPLHLADAPRTEGNFVFRGTQNYYVWSENGQISLLASAGSFYQNRGNAKIKLFPADVANEDGADAADDEGDEAAPIAPPPLDSAEVPPDQKPHPITLKTPRKGLYRVQVSDGSMGTTVEWDGQTPVTVRSSLDQPTSLVRDYEFYFYVPKGTKVVGGFGYGRGEKRAFVIAPDGKATPLPSKAGYFSVPVAPRQDGKLWKFRSNPGNLRLMTVPPYFARSAAELLLPTEVIAAGG